MITQTRFTASLSGQVNNQPIGLEGSGRVSGQTGTTLGQYVMQPIPPGFDPHLFSVFLITGYPQVAVQLPGTHNVFANCTYEYSREVKFQNKDVLHFKARCESSPDTLVSTFHLTGTVNAPHLLSLDPLVEIWVPQGKNGVYGHFTASWMTEEGNRYIAEVTTMYTLLANEKPLDGVHHRFVTIQTTTRDDLLAKHQQVTLFRNFPSHIAGELPILQSQMEAVGQ